MVLGITQRAAVPTVDDEEYEPTNAPEWSAPAAASGGFNDPDITLNNSVKEEAIVNDDDALSYFARLAEED